MLQNPNKPAGVVLDEPLAKAVLYRAVQEGLLDGDPMIGDGFVRNLLSSPPSSDLVDEGFEQLVLGGKLFVPFWLPRQWKGELFERRVIEPVESGPEDKLVEAAYMSPDLVLGMLASRGIQWSAPELEERYAAYQNAYHSWQAVSAGKSFKNIEIRKILRHTIPIRNEEYTDEQLQRWQEVQDEQERMKPVLSCIRAYRQVLTASMRLSALSALPIAGTSTKTLETSTVPDGTEQRKLLKVTARALRRVPIGNNLRETIHLAQSSEAEALRAKLSQWADQLRQGNIEASTVVLPDVEKARKHLSTARTLSRIGELSTCVGVPVAIAGAFLSGPVVVAVGVGVSVVGGVALTGQKLIEGMNQWAMYAREL